MTRAHQKDKEEEVIQKFLEHLSSQEGVEIFYEPEKTESPDFRLFLNNKIVGCELTRMTLEELERWGRGQAGKPEKISKELLKNRADVWMEKLLLKKAKKVEKYKKNCTCEELWLIVHFGIMPIFGHGIRNFERIQKTIKKINHGFDKIWFVGDTGDVRRLWPLA